MLIAPDAKHKLELSQKLTRRENSEIQSFYSKKHLQETVLALAEFYTKHDRFYIPVRLDQRGRVYCDAHYLNYQGTELAKSLIEFAEGGIITKNNFSSCYKYLACYGANCYGGYISKKNFKSKVEWVENNKDNILNIENNILLSDASDKFLFLSFSLEFRRLHDWITNG